MGQGKLNHGFIPNRIFNDFVGNSFFRDEKNYYIE